MANVNPLLLVGAVIGVVTALLVLACALVKDKKETMGFERTMNDGEILRRLAGYAKPYLAKFVVVLFLMLFSIAYDIIAQFSGDLTSEDRTESTIGVADVYFDAALLSCVDGFS